MLTNYLLKAERDAVNSKKDIVHFMTVIEIDRHSHPLYVQRCINEKMEELGLDKTHYSTLVSAWSGDIDERIATCQKQVDAYEKLKKEFPAFYYGPLKSIEALTEAKKIVESGNFLN